MELSPLVALVFVALVGVASQVLAWRLRIPAILLLLVAGILAGPVTGILDPDALFGELLFPFVSLSVAVILFEGSLTLRFHEIRGLERVVRRLVGLGSLVSASLAATTAHFFVGFTWELAAIFGALVVVTGPTVVVPMLRAIRPSAAVGSVLRWEGIVIDPLGALLTVLVFEFVIALRGGGDLLHVAIIFVALVGTGSLTGFAAGYFFGSLLRRHWLPEYLHNVAILNLVFLVFVAANAVAEESGLLAVTVMGITLANRKGVSVDEILNFKESLSILLVSGLFVILAARIDTAAFLQLGWGAVGVFLAVQFLGRPLKVAVSTWGSSLSWRERVLIAWVGPRGIVAAAIAALLALRLGEAGIPKAELMVPLVFSIIIASVLLLGVTARPLAATLGVAEPEPRGLLIVGANRVARTIARALADQGFEVLLADGSWQQTRRARMEGLRTFYGNPVSEHADRCLDLVGIGRMLGLSPEPDVNSLAVLRYRTEFGAGEVYCLQATVHQEGAHRKVVAPERRGRVLFGEEVSYDRLASWISQGATMRATHLTEQFDYHEFHRRYWKSGVPLFALDPKGRLHVFSSDVDLEPDADWTVLALVLPPSEPSGDREASTGTGEDAGMNG